MDTSRIRFRWAAMGTPHCCFSIGFHQFSNSQQCTGTGFMQKKSRLLVGFVTTEPQQEYLIQWFLLEEMWRGRAWSLELGLCNCVYVRQITIFKPGFLQIWVCAHCIEMKMWLYESSTISLWARWMDKKNWLTGRGQIALLKAPQVPSGGG